MNDIPAIPCNFISGFLVVGKTTAILCLLKNKPAHQIWAVLVNEFEEVGIDAAMLRCANTRRQRIDIHEVAGGSLGCAASDLQQLRNYLQQLQLFATPFSSVRNGKLVLGRLGSQTLKRNRLIYP